MGTVNSLPQAKNKGSITGRGASCEILTPNEQRQRLASALEVISSYAIATILNTASVKSGDFAACSTRTLGTYPLQNTQGFAKWMYLRIAPLTKGATWGLSEVRVMKRRQFLIWSSFGAALGVTELARSRHTTPLASSPQVIAIGPTELFAPIRGDVRIAVISDLNSQYGSTEYEPEVHQAIKLIPAWQPDLVLCSGDMVAGQSLRLSDAQIQAMWAGFDQAIGAPLRQAKLPLGFTLGNHDGSGVIGVNGQHTFERDRLAAKTYWSDPNHTPQLNFVDRAQYPFFYTFAQKDIFYLVWDASTAVISAQQLSWVEKSLASSVAQQARLRIVIGHLPLYPVAVGRDKPGEYLAQAEKLRLLLEKYRVHTYISGHDHAYFPGHRGHLQLLQTGALGSGPRRWLNSNLTPRKTLTVVDVVLKDATTRYTTYDMATQQVFDYRILPRTISAPNGLVLRQDITSG